jgi:hypothetical protein
MTATLSKSMVDKVYISSRCFLLMVSALTAWTSGCALHRRPAVHWQPAALVRPIVPEHSQASESPAEEPPDLPLEIPSPLPRLASVRMVPARPRAALSQPVESTTVTKPVEPIIAPQLSMEETETAKRGTQQSLATAERNLSVARGHNLNAAQTDLASKVRGFIDDAREAIGNVDWTRAQALAKKAEVLSSELSRSL